MHYTTKTLYCIPVYCNYVLEYKSSIQRAFLLKISECSNTYNFKDSIAKNLNDKMQNCLILIVF